MKINRLLETVILLLNKKTITAKELADRFSVSTRTIYRDIDVLSTAGVPIFTNKGIGGGISLLEDYSLDKTIITKNEIESLIFALKTLESTQYPEIGLVLDKIGAVFKNSHSNDWVQIDFSPWGSNPNENNKFINIKKAIVECKVILFDYVNTEGVRSRRIIEPMGLTFKWRSWYLCGYCNTKENFRVFRISRIKNVVVTDDLFIRKDFNGFENYDVIEKFKKMVTLKLKFYPEVIYRIYDDFDDEIIKKNEDGTCNVTITFPEDEWVYGYIMSFGCYVEVLEPLYIQEIIKDRMRKALEFYNK